MRWHGDFGRVRGGDESPPLLPGDAGQLRGSLAVFFGYLAGTGIDDVREVSRQTIADYQLWLAGKAYTPTGRAWRDCKPCAGSLSTWKKPTCSWSIRAPG